MYFQVFKILNNLKIFSGYGITCCFTQRFPGIIRNQTCKNIIYYRTTTLADLQQAEDASGVVNYGFPKDLLRNWLHDLPVQSIIATNQFRDSQLLYFLKL